MNSKLKMWLAGATGFNLAGSLLTIAQHNFFAAILFLTALFADAMLWVVFD